MHIVAECMVDVNIYIYILEVVVPTVCLNFKHYLQHHLS